MILLDTDHLTILAFPEGQPHARLTARMRASSDPVFATTIVNAEEQLRGWLAAINRQPAPQQQIVPYEHLRRLLDFLRLFPLIAIDERAVAEFERLRKAKVRIGSSDLKIACIALVHNVLLLSANRRDFEKVPGLRVENWLND
ncbi:MAG TPA: type II toxin-antitoxin system VapC family toxin [Gemmataceae bacterium]|nr:type II toxin-antitoxin system VapC family toxin [Gemmataceae bacterium]